VGGPISSIQPMFTILFFLLCSTPWHSSLCLLLAPLLLPFALHSAYPCLVREVSPNEGQPITTGLAGKNVWDQPLYLSFQATTQSTHLPLIRIGMRRLNRSPFLQEQRVSMEVVWWKRKFCLSCLQPPGNND
jgi:hypothetical protein